MEGWKDWEGLLSEWQKTQLASVIKPEGIQCLLDMWFSTTYDMSEGLFCNATWDNYNCWPPTKAGTVITISCSEAFPSLHASISTAHSSQPASLEGNASRTCLENGTWSHEGRTNYNECANSLEANNKANHGTQSTTSAFPTISASTVTKVQYILFIGSIISLICLGASLAIFYAFRTLRCDRITVHSQLVMAMVLRFILLVVITEPFVLGRDLESSYRSVDVICKGVIVVYLYGTVSSISWMFVQGLYFNTILTTATPISVSTRRHFKFYYFIGWGLPAVLVTIYTCLMAIKPDQQSCWKGYANTDEMYILSIPMIAALILNLGFVFNIARIVYRKSRSQGENSQLKATARAIIILVFVLGVSNLPLAYNPGGKYQDTYIVVNSGFGSVQGIIVSYLFCFNKNEVHEAFQRFLNRIRTRASLETGERHTNRPIPLGDFSRPRDESANDISQPELV